MADFMNLCLIIESIPKALKDAGVVPIYKGGERSMPKKYWPISLTCHLMKIIERIVYLRFLKTIIL